MILTNKKKRDENQMIHITLFLPHFIRLCFDYMFKSSEEIADPIEGNEVFLHLVITFSVNNCGRLVAKSHTAFFGS